MKKALKRARQGNKVVIMHPKGLERIIEPDIMQRWSKDVHCKDKTIGFVPTMGYFHEGHLSLMRTAKEENDFVVVSLFVNPIQFGPSEDFSRYPRDLDRDIKLAEEAGVDILFSPETRMMYPSGYCTSVEVEGISEILCGKQRPGHFKGVATIVCKLFNIVRPQISYFGQKDAQQAIIIKKMVEDLNMDIKVRTLPIVRDKDGLAMSSRNLYLSETERRAALCLYKSIQLADEMVKAGEHDTATLINHVITFISSEPLADIEYVDIVNPSNLSYISRIDNEGLLLLAVRIGRTRLIDNAIIKTGQLD